MLLTELIKKTLSDFKDLVKYNKKLLGIPIIVVYASVAVLLKASILPTSIFEVAFVVFCLNCLSYTLGEKHHSAPIERRYFHYGIILSCFIFMVGTQIGILIH